MDMLEAIQRSLDVVPADYEMVAFVAYANGFKPGNRGGRGAAAASPQESNSLTLEQLVQMFPNGNVTIN